MNITRKLKTLAKVFKAVETSEGDGAIVNRVIGTKECRSLDPFLMLDYFSAEGENGFPDHPHRGFETVTYMQTGKFFHEDFKGHKGEISAGDVQWMTAGKGIVHSEMPDITGENKGFQLWINLPKEHKMCEPVYQEIKSKDFPILNKEGDYFIKALAGKIGNIEGPCKSKGGNISYFDVHLNKGKSFSFNIGEKKNGLFFVYEGAIRVNSLTVPQLNAGVFLEEDLNDVFDVESDGDPAKFILFYGEPIKQPVVQYGPFVMTTRKEIEDTIKDYSEGKNGFEGAHLWSSANRQKI